MPESVPPPANQPALGCLLRLFWMAFGNAALLLVGAQVFQSGQRLSGLDIAYWLVVFLIVAARFTDIRYFAGTDGLGAPSTLADWRRYAIKMVSSAGIAWLVMHLIIELRR